MPTNLLIIEEEEEKEPYRDKPKPYNKAELDFDNNYKSAFAFDEIAIDNTAILPNEHKESKF